MLLCVCLLHKLHQLSVNRAGLRWDWMVLDYPPCQHQAMHTDSAHRVLMLTASPASDHPPAGSEASGQPDHMRATRRGAEQQDCGVGVQHGEFRFRATDQWGGGSGAGSGVYHKFRMFEHSRCTADAPAALLAQQ